MNYMESMGIYEHFDSASFSQNASDFLLTLTAKTLKKSSIENICVDLAEYDAAIVERLLHQRDDLNVVVLVSAGQEEQVASALKYGAIDYLIKPVSKASLESLSQRLSRFQSPAIVAKSWRSKQLLQLAYRIATADATALIQGESGTGKEVIARYIHNNSSRSSKPFVAINCAAIPESMVEATLFGHVKGAFTGAMSSQSGKFEEANGGTLFLDEIGELSAEVQAKLLRVLQEREVERVGSHDVVKLDLRVIAATNINLSDAIKTGRFREDLYFRLAVLPITVPPLRMRRADIMPLSHFIANSILGSACQFSVSAAKALEQYAFPGNIRELENIINRALVMRHGEVIEVADLMLPTQALTEAEQPRDERLLVHEKSDRKREEYQKVIEILQEYGGNRTATAQRLGISTRALRYKISAMRNRGLDIDALITRAA